MTSGGRLDTGDRDGHTGSSAIDRALDLLSIVVHARKPLTLAEIAAEAELPKPTAHRILRILVARNLLRQSHDRSYRLGSEMYALSGETLAQLDFAREARPALEWLHDVTPDAIHFAALTGGALVCVDKIEGRRPYRMASTVGATMGMHCTAIGKLVLAFLPEESAEPHLTTDQMTARTPSTITSHRQMKRELAEIRRRGFAIDDEENEENIRCVGAPVFTASGGVVGGVSVAAPTFNLSLDQALALAPSVVTAACRVSSALGAPPEVLSTALSKIAGSETSTLPAGY